MSCVLMAGTDLCVFVQGVREGETCTFFRDNHFCTVVIFFLFSQGVREGEMCTFFRNNHFCTMVKEDRKLYLLCTDIGYYDKQDLVSFFKFSCA